MKIRMKGFAVLGAVSLAVLSTQAQVIGGCHIFPSNSVWNTRIDTAPVNRDSGTWIANVSPTAALHPDFGPKPYGIPINQAGSSTHMYTVPFMVADQSDAGPYPIPAKPAIEAEASNGCNALPNDGNDHHLLVVDSGSCKLYEMYQASCRLVNGKQSWSAYSGAVWTLGSNALRPDGFTSADAAGLPITPGLVRYAEVTSGHINHALRMTFNHTNDYQIWPARHNAGLSDSSLPPMGARVRLKASVDISGFPADAQVLLLALKQYGAFVADNGSSGFLTGEQNANWNMDDMLQIRNLHVSDLEFVDESMNQVGASSGQDSGVN